jgi:hypothetical protein
MGGGALGAALFGPERDEHLLYLSAIFLVLAPFPLLKGTGATREPLFLVLFLPMPLLMSTGFHLSRYYRPAFMPLQFTGMAWPFIAYPIISRFYRRRRPQLQ